MSMKFDFTGMSLDGYSVLPPGRYLCEVGKWFVAKKEATQNLVYRIMLTVKEGDFAGETLAYFHTQMTNGPRDKMRVNQRFMLSLLFNIGIVKKEDKLSPSDPLDVEMEYGVPDEDGQQEVTAIKVNGISRPVDGYKVFAIVVKSDLTQSGMKVDRLERYAGELDTSASRKNNPKPVELPF